MWLYGVFLFSLYFTFGSPTTITRISPQSGSTNGGTLVTLYGTGFSQDQFAHGDGKGHLGNIVTFWKAGGGEVQCATHVDGSTETMVQCNTPSGLTQDVDYWVRLSVDGVTVPSSGYPNGDTQHDMVTFTPTSYYTPTITSVTPASGRPGTEITIKGRIVTQRFGSDTDISPNSREEMISRIYAMSLCDPFDGDILKINLDSDTSYFGTISCIPEGTYVGNTMISYLVDGAFGRSDPKETATRTDVDDETYMFQYYTDVQNVTPRTGSTNGGVVITVSGGNYETGGEGIQSTYSLARLYVGGTECIIIEVVKNGDITCTVAAMPAAPPDGRHRGNRGVTVETHGSYSFTSYDDLSNLATPASSTMHFDDVKYCASDSIGDVEVNTPTRLIGRYVAPHDGSFAFFLKASGAALYVNDVRQALSESGHWSSDDVITLVRNQEYRVVVAAQGMAAGKCVETKVLLYDTLLTSQQSPMVTQETQTIQLRSDQLPQAWTLAVTPSTEKTATKQVQRVCVEGSGSYFTVSLHGMSTEPSTVDAASFKEVLDKLPILAAGEDFDVVYSEADSCFTVTFNSNRGDFAEFEDNDDTNTITVTTTAGIPDDKSFSIRVGDVISPPLTFANLTDVHLTTAIGAMLGVQCPSRFTTGASLYDGFERGAPTFGLTAVKNIEAFCGRHSAHSPTQLFPMVGSNVNDLLLYFSPVMCFAYAGTFTYLKVDYTDPDQVYHGSTWIADDRFADTTTWDETRETYLWRYTCINLFDELNDGQPGPLLLHRAWLGSNTDFWVDDVFFGVSSTLDGIRNIDGFDVTSLRYGPAMMNSDPAVPFLIDEFTLSNCDDPLTQCDLEMTPFDCGNDYTTFEIFGNSENVVSFVQTQAASLPLTGTYTLSWTGASVGPPGRSTHGTSSTDRSVSIDAQADDETIRLLLEQVPGIGNIAVSRSTTSDCANADIWVKFLNQPGNQPSMELTSFLVAPDTRSVAVMPNTDGHLKYEPIPAGMVFTEENKPQVVVYINDVPTECAAGADCSFEWSDAVTPKVTHFSPAQGNFGVGDGLLTITGELFSSTASDNEVTVADVPCIVQIPATATQIMCALGNGPIGEYDVIVTVKGQGRSKFTAAVQFRYTADLASMSATQGGMAGQNIVTLTGYGFSETCQVEFYKPGSGAAPCDLVTPPTPTGIQCRVPIADLSKSVDIEKTVRVAYTANTYLPTTLTYTYLVANAATITDINPSVLSVTGGQQIVVTGSNLGNSGSLTIDGVAIPIDEHTPTQVTATVPATGLSPKDGAPFVLDVENSGAAVKDGSSFGIPTVDVKLEIVGITPSHGSYLGGTTVGITGAGFGTDPSVLSVTVGGHACPLDRPPTDSSLSCTIAETSTVHRVTNGGIHPMYGIFYAFDEKTVTVYVGDYVHWSWSTPGFVVGVKHGIRETISGTDNGLLEGGIHSGELTPNGEYIWQFTQPAMHNIWSDYVDGIRNYWGKIIALERPDTAGHVEVKVAGHSALHKVPDNPPAAAPESCAYSTGAISDGCVDPIPSDANTHHFIFSSCYTPTVTAIDFTDVTDTSRSATTNTEVTVTGVGFGDEVCAVGANIGSDACICDSIRDQSPTSFKCTPTAECADVLSLFTYHVSFDVGVQNYGHALVDIRSRLERSIAFVPLVTSVTPNSGSKGGGTLVTIDGSGLTDIDTITFSGVTAADIVITSDTRVTCRTPSVSTDAPVQVVVGQGSRTAVCDPGVTEVGTPCRYTFSSDNTPLVSTVVPDTVATTSNTQLTITGSKLGTDATKVSVHIGDDDNTGCTNVAIISPDTVITCTVTGIPAGPNAVVVVVDGLGIATTPPSPVTGSPVLDSVSPTTGSIHGNTAVAISGHGFYSTTIVTIGTSECEIVDGSTSLAGFTILTPPNTAGMYDVSIVSNGVTFPTRPFEYSYSVTPTVATISPTTGVSGDSVTITATNFGTDPAVITVTIGTAECSGVAITSTTIQCSVGDHTRGLAGVVVHVQGLGQSHDATTFTYTIRADGVAPATGNGRGGQLVTVNGAGFTDDVTVSVCGAPCVYDSHTDVTIVCVTPAGDAAGGPCDVVVRAPGAPDITLPSAYTYTAGGAPTIDDIAPARGGTAGGTLVVIAGSEFGVDSGVVNIDIAGSPCTVESLIDTEIQCRTSAHVGTMKATVVVSVGAARATRAEGSTGNGEFYYVNAWSSIHTWGGMPVPVAREMVVIPKGETILLDTDTDVLAMLLIQGGALIFDDKDLELKADTILITDGGLLQVGESETKPFRNKAYITLYGHARSRELPIYGNKVLGVREGTLNLFGEPVVNTWTKLDGTASAGDSSITVVDDVSDWNAGDEVVVATTGHHLSQSENEKMTIASVSGQVVSFTEPLEYTHTGVDEQYTGPGGDGDIRTVEFRAEVGLLTRNIVVRGNNDIKWHDIIVKCETGFDTGQFSTQTCFDGRFGEEIGSNQFGAHILIHSPEKDTQTAQAHLSYIEVTFAGQAFRLGRYPIHFHILGDSDQSFVKGCAIHETFNRAINIHGTNNVLIERNVVYNVMGGAIFLEDGVEIGNVFDYNLCVFARSSSSLLNDDVTPACYWVTNADNVYRHNAAAGGTHFGYWFRMRKLPDGPHADSGVCPRNVPLREFSDNTAHSFGRFGLWVFEEFQPQIGGACGNSMHNVQVARFDRLTVWNCDKGGEFVNSGALQIHGGVFVQNRLAGFEGKMVKAVQRYDATNGFIVEDTLIVGRTESAALQQTSTQGTTDTGLVVPFGEGFIIRNVKFMHFDVANTRALMLTVIQGTCSEDCNGYNFQTYKLSFENVLYRGKFRWGHETAILDMDGSLCDTDGPRKITPRFGTAVINSCPDTCGSFFDSSTVDAAVCSNDMKFHRWAFNNISPASLKGKDVIITKENGDTTTAPYKDKRLSHKGGWMMILENGATYTVHWKDTNDMTNISFTARFSEFPDELSCVGLRLKALTKPDRFSIDGGVTAIAETTDGTVSCSNSAISNGDWQYDVDGYVTFAIKGSASSTRRKRSMTRHADDIDISLTFYDCFFDDCIPPPDPNTVPPATTRPDVFGYWHTAYWAFNDVTSIWEGTHVAPARRRRGSALPLPDPGSDVTILKDAWVVVGVDSTLPTTMGVLRLEGVLEFDYLVPDDHHYSLNAETVIIMGGRLLAGWTEFALPCSLTITLLGSRESPAYESVHTDPWSRIPGFPIAQKAVAVFGGLDLFGRDPGITWTKLTVTADVGATTLVVEGNASGWKPDDTVVVTSTNNNPDDTETVIVTSAIYNDVTDETTISINSALAHKHVVSDTAAGDGTEHFAGAVGLLTRAILVRGQYHAGDHVGARVLVAITQVTKPDGGTQLHAGYTRLHNVEFVNMGHEGYTAPHDARYAVAVVGTGAVSIVKPTHIENCSFRDLYNGAIAALGVSDMEIIGNVVHNALGDTIVTQSLNTKITNNLISCTQWTGSFDGRLEPENIRYEAAVDAMGSKGLALNGNYVAGSQRVGYHVPGETCGSGASLYGTTAPNWSVGNVMGVAVFPDDDIAQVDGQTCSRFQGFRIWSNLDYGLYYNHINSAEFANDVFADSKVALFPMVVGPSSLAHIFEEKTVTLRDSTLIGHTAGRDCSSAPSRDLPYLNTIDHCMGISGPNGESIGAVFGQFTQSQNSAPKKPCAGIMSYNSLGGKTTITGVTIAGFGPHPDCGAAIAISSNSENEDLQHPMEVSDNTIIPNQIDRDFILAYHRPNVGKINPADCVDMDCDALKKMVLDDLDGTTLGYAGAAVSESEWQWDVYEEDVAVDARRGLGDYRVPKDMVTALDGSRIPYTKLRDHQGIVRDNDCYKTTGTNFAYWNCPGITYRMLVIESLDVDTELRRLSPVAILSERYLDLVNGPQDHGWCSGYTCQKRLSTFHTLVSPGRAVTVYLSSTSPDKTRFFLLNADDADCLVMSFYYSKTRRIDVYTDDGETYVEPTNGQMADIGTAQERFILLNDHTPAQYKPDCTSSEPKWSSPGANYIDHESHLMHVVIKGIHMVIMKRKNVIIVAFGLPAMTEAEFFGSNMLANLAAILNIPLDRIRVVRVVAEDGRRRKRSTGIVVDVEVASGPLVTASDDDTEDLTMTAIEMMNICQGGTMAYSLGTDGTGARCDYLEIDEVVYTPVVPTTLEFADEITAAHELAPFSRQPRIRALDQFGRVIPHLGLVESPWEITASLRVGTGHAVGSLDGTVTVTSAGGMFDFTDLAISHAGSGYIMDFTVSGPPIAAAMNLSLGSLPFDVASIPMTAGVHSMTDGDIRQNGQFALTLDLRDATTDTVIADPSWRGHTFATTCALPAPLAVGNLTGTLARLFDTITGRAQMDDLVLTGYGPIYIVCHVVSTPAEFDFEYYHQIFVVGESQLGIVREKVSKLEFRFGLDFQTTLPTSADQAVLHQTVAQDFVASNPDIIITSADIREGSILIMFAIEGTTVNVTATAKATCEAIAGGKSYTVGSQTFTLDKYMTIDGQDYYGTTCGADDEEDGLHMGYIALIAVIGVLLLAAILFFTLWKLKVIPRTKTHDNGKTVYLAGPGDKTENIFFNQKSARPNSAAPEATLYGYKTDEGVRRSPDPIYTTDRTLTSRSINLGLQPKSRSLKKMWHV